MLKLFNQFKTIIADKDGFAESAFFIFVLKIQHSPGTNGRANSTSHTGRTNNILPSLGIPSYINSHLTIGGAISTGNALAPIGGDPEPGLESLNESKVGSKGASKSAPDPVAH